MTLCMLLRAKSAIRWTTQQRRTKEAELIAPQTAGWESQDGNEALPRLLWTPHILKEGRRMLQRNGEASLFCASR